MDIYPPKSPWGEEEYTPPALVTAQLPAPAPAPEPEPTQAPPPQRSFRKFIAAIIVAEWMLFINGLLMMLLVAADVKFDARRLMWWWGYLLMLLPIVSCACRWRVQE